MLRKIDEILNSITMYRLVLYYLILLLVVAFVFSFFGVFPFTPVDLLISSSLIFGVSWITNHLFAKLFKVQTNLESVYITFLILSLIVTPSRNITELFFIVLIAFIAQASKYILAAKHKHIFNPAGIAIAISAVVFGRYASWWIGSITMLPFLLLGFLVIRKLRRFSMIFSYLTITIILFFVRGLNISVILPTILFFSFVMLPEPLTMPPTRRLQVIYALIIGIIFSLQINISGFYLTLEVALLIGNIFSYIVGPKANLTLTLKKKTEMVQDIYEFVFNKDKDVNFKPGQYFEWTLGFSNPDVRGERRFFTIASSPTEEDIKIGVRFPIKRVSSFKSHLLTMKIGDKIFTHSLAGDFVMPKDTNTKLVFVAGGIGITPFRSMIKYLLDTGEVRDIVLIYNERSKEGFVYKDVFEEAQKKLNIKIIYFETQTMGYVTEEVIKKNIPDYKKRTFYLSGPHAMVTSFEDMLSGLKLSGSQVKVDYFPGY